jgi:hypothetical protein
MLDNIGKLCGVCYMVCCYGRPAVVEAVLGGAADAKAAQAQ